MSTRSGSSHGEKVPASILPCFQDIHLTFLTILSGFTLGSIVVKVINAHRQYAAVNVQSFHSPDTQSEHPTQQGHVRCIH